MTQWNPNAPEIIGLEWFPGKMGNDTILSAGVALAQRTQSLAAETIGDFQVWASAVVAGGLMMEVYEAGDELPGAPVSVIERPTGDDTVTAVQNQAAAILNLYQSVDEATLNTADYITQTGAASAGIYSSTYSGLAAWPVARRVLDIQLSYVVAATTSVAQQVSCHVLDGTGNDLIVRQDAYSQGQGIVTFTASLGPDNPFTALPWTQADIVALSSAAPDLEIALVFEDQGGGAPNFRLYQQWLTITYCDETRVAVASADVAATAAPAVVSMTNVQVPDTGVATWAKANNTLYTYLLRATLRPQTTGTMRKTQGWFVVPWVDSGSVAPLQTNDEAVSYSVTLAAGARPSSLGAEQTRLRGVLPVTTGPAASESGQPFVRASSLNPPPLNTVYTEIFGAADFSAQAVTTTAARTFSRVSVIVRPMNAEASPDLSIDITAVYGGAAVATVTVTAAEVLALENIGTDTDPWYRVDALLAVPLAVGAATVRYIECHCPAATTADEGWEQLFLGALGSVGPTSTYSDDATYLGATNRLAVNGAIGDAYYDAPATLATIPDPPANVGAVATEVDLPGSGESCSLDTYEAVTVDWDASADALVTLAEVQRYDDLTDSWDTIAFVEQDTPTLTYLDPDPAQNLVNAYRVRFLRSTGEASDWSTEATATPSFLACGLIFVPWGDSASAVGYVWPTPSEWEFQDAEQLVIFPIYGADGQVAFRPTETLGDAFEAVVTVNAAETPTPREGRWVLDRIVDLAHDPTSPYVSVLDETGRRWYAALQVPRGSRKEPEAYYAATVRVTTLQLVPTPVTT